MRENGNINVELTSGTDGMISCAKVGGMQQGKFVLEPEYHKSGVDLNTLKTARETQSAAEKLVKYEKDGLLKETERDGTTLFAELETGVYLIRGYRLGHIQMQPTLVFLPTWDETTGEMLYDVTVVPKTTQKVNTGDSTSAIMGAVFGFSAVVILLALFWKKRLRKRKNCDTIL